MGQTQKVSGRATSVQAEGGRLRTVRYPNTDVVTVYAEGSIKLNSDGHRTHTTKTRMNQAANQFGLGYQVWQKNFEWFVSWKGKDLPFSDGMILI